jgi:hypothetical protein
MNVVQSDWFPFACAATVVGFLVMLPIQWRILRGHRQMALLCWVFCVATGAWILREPQTIPAIYQGEQKYFNAVLWLAAKAMLWIFLLPWCGWLYLKWILGEVSEAEKRDGMDGIRAWLSPGNVLLALIISFCSWQDMNVRTRHLITLTLLGAGLLVMLSLLTDNYRFASIGIILCLAGYAVAILGAVQEWRTSLVSQAGA